MRTPALASHSLSTRRSLETIAIWLGTASVILSCRSATESHESRAPDVLAIVAGDGQTITAGKALASPLTVMLTGGDGTPRAGVKVSWTVVSGGGSVDPGEQLTDSHGLASTTWTLGQGTGPQTVSARAIGSDAPALSFNATSLALRPVIIRYNGQSWRTELADTNLTHIQLLGVWGTSPRDLFAVGQAPQAVVLRFDGTSWSTVQGYYSGNAMTAVSGRTMDDVYFAARWALPPSAGRSIFHLSGQTWGGGYSEECSFHCFGAFTGLWAFPGSDVFAVGDSTIVHFDGTTWTTQPSGTAANLMALWGAAPNRVFAVGTGGTILTYDGAVWHSQASGVTETLNGVWGTSATDVYAVGTKGTLLHYDGMQWTLLNSGTSEDLFAITGTSDQLFAVGNNATIVRYDGTRWSSQSAPIAIDLRSVWAASPTQVVAVGSPR